MSKFNEFIKYRLLDFKYGSRSGGAALLEQALKDGSVPGVKNVCVQLSSQLVEEWEAKLEILGMSKRDYVELLLIDSLERVDGLEAEVDPFSPFVVDGKEGN